MSARLIAPACLALPLRSTGATADAIVTAHAEPIRAALGILVREAS